MAKLLEPLPSPTPPDLDGREIDPTLGVLSGEGALQRVRHAGDAEAHPTGELIHAPPSTFPGDDAPTYYGLPAIKAPMWKWYIPAYFYVGGASGALGVLGAAATLFGRGKLETLRHRAKWMGLAGEVIGAGLLLVDLGRPERFLNMMRVFRPTSPMNLGTWVLAGSGASSSAAILFGDTVRGRVGEVAAGVFGLPLAGYTAVLLANTAVPSWQLANRTLPFLFIANAVSSAAALLQMQRLTAPEQRVVNRFATLGRAAESIAADAVERSVRRVPRAFRAFQEGPAGALWKTSRVLGAASLAITLFGNRRRWAQLASGVLGTASALALRFAVIEGGKQSARDPKATFQQQRAGLGAAEVCGPTRDPKTGEVIAYPLPVVR